jgi:SnoaL-like domain
VAAHLLIREYYACFNERRFENAAELFTLDAVIEHPPLGRTRRGPDGYLDAARFCTAVFPDCRLQLLRVEQRGDTICEVDLLGTGTHLGDLDMGSLGVFKATGKPATLRIRELLEIRSGRITYSSLRYDMQEFVSKFGARADT